MNNGPDMSAINASQNDGSFTYSGSIGFGRCGPVDLYGVFIRRFLSVNGQRLAERCPFLTLALSSFVLALICQSGSPFVKSYD